MSDPESPRDALLFCVAPDVFVLEGFAFPEAVPVAFETLYISIRNIFKYLDWLEHTLEPDGARQQPQFRSHILI
jgi:hypothetical protein